MKLVYRLYDDIFEGQKFGYEFYRKRLTIALKAEFPNAEIVVENDNSPRNDYGAVAAEGFDDNETAKKRADQVEDYLWQNLLATNAWEAGGICNILNDTVEWVLAGRARVLKPNDDGTYRIQTARGIVTDVPPQCVGANEYICKGCVGNSFCAIFCGDGSDHGDHEPPTNELTYEDLKRMDKQLNDVVAEYEGD